MKKAQDRNRKAAFVNAGLLNLGGGGNRERANRRQYFGFRRFSGLDRSFIGRKAGEFRIARAAATRKSARAARRTHDLSNEGMSFWMSFSIATVCSKHRIAFGKIDLRVGLGVPHQARQTHPSRSLPSRSPADERLRSNVQNSAR